MYAENESVIKRNEVVLNKLPGKHYTVETNDKIPDNCKYLLVLMQASQNGKQKNTGCFTKIPKLKAGAKVILKVDIDMQDHLINGQMGIIRHIEFPQGSAHKVYIKLTDD